MQRVIISAQGKDSALRRALGRDLKGKLSPLAYVAGVALSFVDTRVAGLLYAGAAVLWLVPDRRVEKLLDAGAEA
jgi:hypothetical protein